MIRHCGRGRRARSRAALLAAAALLLPKTTTPAPAQGTGAPPPGLAALNQALLAEAISLRFYQLNAGQSYLAGADQSALAGMIAEIQAGHQAHLTLLQQMLGASATPAPSFQSLSASTLPQFLATAQMLEDIDVGVHQGVILSALETGVLNPLGGSTSATNPGIYGAEGAILADDARYDGALRAFIKHLGTGQGGNPNTTLTPTGTPLSPGFTLAQATAALQPFIISSAPSPPPPPPTTGTTTTGSTTAGTTAGTTTGGTATPPSGGTAPPPAAAVSFSKDILRIFTNNGAKTCAQAGCHAPPNPQLGQNLSAATAYANIVNVHSVEKPALLRVKPGDAANSYLYQKITGARGIAGSMMPLAGGPLTAGDMALIQQWINEGAPNN